MQIFNRKKWTKDTISLTSEINAGKNSNQGILTWQSECSHTDFGVKIECSEMDRNTLKTVRLPNIIVYFVCCSQINRNYYTRTNSASFELSGRTYNIPSSIFDIVWARVSLRKKVSIWFRYISRFNHKKISK